MSAQRRAAMSIVFQRESGRCYWCQRAVRRLGWRDGPWPADMATLDHVVPKSQGGRDTSDNLVLACLACNNERGSLSAEAFLRVKLSRLGASA